MHGNSRDDLLRFATPKFDAGIRVNNPWPVRVVNKHSTPKGLAPTGHSAVEVRMRNRNRFKPTKQSNDIDRGVIQKANAVPEYIAGRRSDQKGTLSYSKPGHGGEGKQFRCHFPVGIKMVNAQLG